MFNISKNSVILDQYSSFLEKKLLTNELAEIKSKIIRSQQELLKFLDMEYNGQSKYLLKNLSKLFHTQSKIYIKASETEKKIIESFLDNDLKKIIGQCISLKDILSNQNFAIDENDLVKYRQWLNAETEELQKLKDILKKDGELEKKFAMAYQSAKGVDYIGFLAKAKHIISRLGSKYKILPPIGVWNIPLNGPVIIAPRHYEAGIDTAALFSAIPRRAFTMVGVDWVQTGTQNLASKLLYSGLGTVKVNRQGRPDSDTRIQKSPYYENATTKGALKQVIFLLQAKEAIIIFPEGWANEGRTQGHIDKPSGILPAQEGFLLCIELAQREMVQTIPVIPTGMLIDTEQKTIQAVFGKPLYYINGKMDKKVFGQQVMSEIKRLSGL